MIIWLEVAGFMKMSREGCLCEYVRAEVALVLDTTLVYTSVVHNDEGCIAPGGGNVLC